MTTAVPDNILLLSDAPSKHVTTHYNLVYRGSINVFLMTIQITEKPAYLAHFRNLLAVHSLPGNNAIIQDLYYGRSC